MVFLFRKLRGEEPVPYKYTPSCVGLCYLNKLRGHQVPAVAEESRKPCIGLCYLAKLGKVEVEEEDIAEIDIEDEEDYEESLEDKK